MKTPKIGDVAKMQIDANLKRIFDEDAAQDLPETLVALLAKLDDVEVPDALKSGGPKAGSDDDPERET